MKCTYCKNDAIAEIVLELNPAKYTPVCEDCLYARMWVSFGGRWLKDAKEGSE